MATIALPRRRAALARTGTGLALVIGTAGTLLSWFGSGWDVSWHRIFGRDTFWSTPHLFIYAGVTLWGVSALVATATTMAGRPIRGRAMQVGPFRAELGLALVGIGALVTIAAGPFDNLWHALFGRDVDIWSPPHLAGIAGGAIGLLGWIAAFAPGTFSLDDWLRRLLRLITLGNILAISVFALNFYYVTSVAREGFFYPLLISVLVPASLAVATTVVPGRWPATSAALAYTATALVGYALLAGSGWRPPAFPPLVLAGAVAIDLARQRGGLWAGPLALGAVFTFSFVAAELLRMVLFPPPVPTSALGAAEPRLGNLFFQYYEQTVARPWLSLWPLAAAVLGAPVAAVSWRIGRRVGLWLADDRDAEALANP
ncbi:MAG TPA: hypothetical protein VGR87_05390 [Candidatus Limnocylindria bacterium]|jgi:hypothetical protein|nr:hypothetical protein [Candidatus Limnocylindria bacterium]